MNTTYQVSNDLYLSKCMFLGWYFHTDEGNKRYLSDIPATCLTKMMNDCPVASREAFRTAISETEKKRGTEHYTARKKHAETDIRLAELDIEKIKERIESRKAEIFEVEWKKTVIDLLHAKAFGEAVVPPEDFYFINDIDIAFCKGRLVYVIDGGPKRHDSIYVDLYEYVDKIFKVYC